jgi:hypothetical protein
LRTTYYERLAQVALFNSLWDSSFTNNITSITTVTTIHWLFSVTQLIFSLLIRLLRKGLISQVKKVALRDWFGWLRSRRGDGFESLSHGNCLERDEKKSTGQDFSYQRLVVDRACAFGRVGEDVLRQVRGLPQRDAFPDGRIQD